MKKPVPIKIPVSTMTINAAEAKSDHEKMEEIRERVRQWIKNFPTIK
jgi:hypothetical protein